MTQYTWDQLQALWVQAGGSQQTAPMAAAIAMAESGGNSNARSPKSGGYSNGNGADYGLWQINSKFNGGGDADFDPLTNARKAVQISKNGTSWRSWCTAYSDGLCGTKGGSYLGSGSPFLKFLSAHGGSFTGGDATPPGGDSGDTVTPAGLSLNPTSWMKALADIVVKPAIQFIWNVAETGIGLALMIGGIYLLAKNSAIGQGTGQAVRQLEKVTPETRAVANAQEKTQAAKEDEPASMEESTPPNNQRVQQARHRARGKHRAVKS